MSKRREALPRVECTTVTTGRLHYWITINGKVLAIVEAEDDTIGLFEQGRVRFLDTEEKKEPKEKQMYAGNRLCTECEQTLGISSFRGGSQICFDCEEKTRGSAEWFLNKDKPMSSTNHILRYDGDSLCGIWGDYHMGSKAQPWMKLCKTCLRSQKTREK